MKCIICGKEAGEYGNNPAPITEVGRCCDECNGRLVVPLRLCASSVGISEVDNILFDALNKMSRYIYAENKEEYDDGD